MVRGYKRGTRWPKPHQSCRPSLPANINLWKSRLCRSPARRQQSSTVQARVPQLEALPVAQAGADLPIRTNQVEDQSLDINENLFEDEDRASLRRHLSITTAATQSSRSGNPSWVHLFKRRPQLGMFSEMYDPNFSPHISEMPAKCPHTNERGLLSRGILLQLWSAKLLTQEERDTCTNPSGLRSYLAKTFKKILMEGSSTINGYTNPANPIFHLTNYRRPISASFWRSWINGQFGQLLTVKNVNQHDCFRRFCKGITDHSDTLDCTCQ